MSEGVSCKLAVRKAFKQNHNKGQHTYVKSQERDVSEDRTGEGECCSSLWSLFLCSLPDFSLSVSLPLTLCNMICVTGANGQKNRCPYKVLSGE